MDISQSEKTNLENTYTGIELKYGVVDGMTILSGDVCVKYNGTKML